MTSHEFDFVISYASEDEAFARKLYETLAVESKVFFAPEFQAEIWGANLYEYLHDMYSKRGLFCILLISEYYVRKKWTLHEWRVAQERALAEVNKTYVLPIRLDDAKLPGLLDTTAYLDARVSSIEEIAALALQKLNSSLSLASSLEWCEIPAGHIELRGRTPLGRTRKRVFQFQPFRITRSPITYSQFQLFIEDPRGATNQQWWRDLPTIGIPAPKSYIHPPLQRWRSDDYPRVNVCSYDAMAFARWLTEQLGFEVRLPRESELLFAIRATSQSWYDSEVWLDLLGRITLDESERRDPSESKAMDIVENIWEWCLGDLNEFFHVLIEPETAMCILDPSDLTKRSYTPDAHMYDENTGFRLVHTSEERRGTEWKGNLQA